MTGHRIGIIDDHAHPFPLRAEPLDLAGITLDVDDSEAGGIRRRQLASGRLALEAMRVRLAQFLGCSAEELESARAEAAVDWPRYVHSLFDDVGLDGMLLDGGPHPLGAARLHELQTVSGVPSWSLFRIEAVLDPLIEQGLDAEEVLSGVSDAIAAAAAAGAVGCKTVLAYRTGLAVDAGASLADARRSLAAGTAEPTRRRGKALRIWCCGRPWPSAASSDYRCRCIPVSAIRTCGSPTPIRWDWTTCSGHRKVGTPPSCSSTPHIPGTKRWPTWQPSGHPSGRNSRW